MKVRDMFIDREKFEAKRSLRRSDATTKLMAAAGLSLTDHTLVVAGAEGKGTYSLRHARAAVETRGVFGVTNRLTITRMVTFGIFSLAMPKRVATDTRVVWLTVSGPGWIVRRPFAVDLEPAVLEYADRINRRIGT